MARPNNRRSFILSERCRGRRIAWLQTECSMLDRRTVRNTVPAELIAALRPHIVLAALTALAAAPIALSLAFVPPEAVLPLISLTALALAAVAALVAWTGRAKRGGDRVTLWDISGALVFIGCAAAMLSKPDNVLHLLGIGMIP
jgi:putative Mn2+ efflux pump MntP